MKVPVILCTTILTLLAGCQHQDNISTTFTALTGSLFQSRDEKQMNRISNFIREGDIEKAEIEASQLATPFLRAQSLSKIAYYQIIEQNDLVGAKKLVEKLDPILIEIQSKEDKLFSQIELADLLHFIDRERSQNLLKSLLPEIWAVVDPIERSKLLIRLTILELQTQEDVKKAKVTIEQTNQTIQFIQKSSIRSSREKELKNVLQINNHILCRDP